MSVHAECPVCRQRQSLRNKRCRCGEDLDKAKKAARVKYWIAYRIPLESDGGEAKMVQRWEFVGYSLEEAKDANGKRRVQKRENRIFEILPTAKMTFAELTKWYLDLDVVKSLRYYPTFQFYIGNFNKEFANRVVGSIKAVELENYQVKRKAAGFSDSYVDHEVGAAKTIVYKAHENDLVDGKTVLTFRKVKKLLKKKANARKKTLAPGQFASLMEHLPLHTKQILVTGFFTGMRKGEITGLLRSKVNMAERVIELEATDTKDKDPRIVPFGDEVYAILKSIPQNEQDDHVFLYRGKPVKDIRTGLKKACVLAGIPYGQKVKGGFVFHDLRHTFNTYMRKAGIAESVIMDITGHATREMFDWYNTVDADDRKIAIQRFERFMQEEFAKSVKKKKVDHFVDQRGKKGLNGLPPSL
ncbi:MAG TPA: site-specific integrase [Syntrophorhabdales bacterium]|nr:site-specific integrase [Syntrophorhabdales bacterium]